MFCCKIALAATIDDDFDNFDTMKMKMKMKIFSRRFNQEKT